MFWCFRVSSCLGLSPIVGAFAGGWLWQTLNAIEKIRDYTKKFSVVFSPVFFGLAGAQFDVRSFILLDWFFYVFFTTLITVAVSKMIGCGLPAAYFLKDRSKALKSATG